MTVSITSGSENIRYRLCLQLLACTDFRAIDSAEALKEIIERRIRPKLTDLRGVTTRELMSLIGPYYGTDFQRHLVSQLSSLNSECSGLVASGDEELLLRAKTTVPATLMEMLFVRTQHDGIDHQLNDLATGDSHLHSGGIVGPIETIRPLVSSLAVIDPSDDLLILQDVCGQEFAVEPLLYFLAFLSVLGPTPEILANPRFTNLCAADGVTDILDHCWALAKARDASSLPALKRMLSEACELGGQEPSLAIVENRILRWTQHEATAEATRPAAALSAMCLIHHGLTMSPSSCLDEFNSRFGLLSRLRKLGNTDRSKRLARAISALSGDGFVSRMELRKNISIPSVDDRRDTSRIAAEIREDLVEHMLAVAQVRESSPGSPFIAGMPVSFAKVNREVDWCPTGSQRRLAFSIGDYLTAAEGLASLVVTEPWTADLIGGLDGVGLETGTPNWVLSLCYSWFMSRVPPEIKDKWILSVHAGEQYANPTNGLRMIGELRDFTCSVERVGHGIALAASHTAAEVSVPSGLEALWDIIWMADLLDDDTDLAALAVQMGTHLSGSQDLVTWEDLKAWRKRLFSLEHMQRIGLLPHNAGSYTFESLSGLVEPATLSISDGADRLVAATLIEGGFMGILFANPMRASDIRSYKGLVVAKHAEVRQRLIASWTSASVECCPTSNVLLGSVESYADHPIWELINLGIPVTLSTDDPGLFGTSLKEEYVRLLESKPLELRAEIRENLIRVAKHSADQTFPGMLNDNFERLLTLVRSS